MVIVDGAVAKGVWEKIEQEIANEPTNEEIENHLKSQNLGDAVYQDTYFWDEKHKKFRLGFYMDGYIKSNFDNYLIKAVAKKWDGTVLVTGLEGSGKSTATFGFAKYVDPSFPGAPLNDGTLRRKCTRIVFTPEQLIEAIDNSEPRQAIVMDEAVLGFMASDASTQIQKILIKKMVTIRKKRLFLFFVLPSIFLLRMYMAVFRTRCCIHFFTPDGISRGVCKFYGYDTKRRLYINGKKEFNQDCVKEDFIAYTTNTEGFFFDPAEYEAKKDKAILQITSEPKKEEFKLTKTQLKTKAQRDTLIMYLYKQYGQNNYTHFSKWMKTFCFELGATAIKQAIENAYTWQKEQKEQNQKKQEIENYLNSKTNDEDYDTD